MRLSQRTKAALLLGLVLLALVGAFTAVVWGDPPPAGPTTVPAVKDDAPALQKRLANNDTVVTLAGDYHAATPVVLQNVHGLTVFAYGARITASPAQPRTVRLGDTLRLENCSDVRIFGLTVNGNRQARGGYANDPQAVHLLGSNDITLRDCTVTGAVCDGVFVWGGMNPKTPDLVCQRVLIDHCNIADVGRSCVSLVGACGISVVNCDLSDAVTSNPGCGVDVEANTGDPDGVLNHITLANNRVRNVRGGGFYVIKTGPQPQGVVIANNQIDKTQWDAISNYALGTLIIGNNVSNCARAGISNLKPGTMQTWGNNATIYQEQ